MTKDRLAIAANHIRITRYRRATGVEAGTQGLSKAPGHGWSGWLANVKQRRRLARERRLEWIEREQRLERRQQQSARRHPPHWL